MAGREFLGKLIRHTSRPVTALTVLSLLLAAAVAASWRYTSAARAAGMEAQSPSVKAARAQRGAGGRVVRSEQGRQPDHIVLGEFEGSFDATKKSFKVVERQTEAGAQVESADGGVSVPLGSYTFRFKNAAFIAPPSPPVGVPAGTVSVEAEVGNTTASHTFYNTRAIFTNFRRITAPAGPAANSPGVGGLAFFNDGQVAAEGQLGVSRNYGDISPGSAKSLIWTFAAPADGPTFYFRFVLLADLGVAAESVEPAAVQVTGAAGSSVKIRGRGFSGTPTVNLLDASGNVVGSNLPVSNATATSLDVTVPQGTAAGVYGLRVTNPGGTAGGFGSSRIPGRLTVTPVPTLGLSALVNGSGGAGPYLISGAATISNEVSIQPGTVIYLDAGATLQIAGTGNLIANGGIPGVPGGAGIATPAQIVFTAQRAPGAALPSRGAWGGINATAASNATMVMRNVVVEYGGASCGAQIDITGSGRTLRFADSISRSSAGAGLKAFGANDVLVGLTRSSFQNNGTSATCDAALLLSANASLGLYGLEPTGGTSVVDGSYYYSSANSFAQGESGIAPVVQIGSDSNAASNDFTKSGVLVGQGTTPLQLRGSSTNPAVIGNAGPAPGAELTVTPNALLQLAAGTDVQAGNASLFGGLAANGFAGHTHVPGLAPDATAFSVSQRILFQKTPGGGNWGALYFSPKSSPSSILNYVMLDGGGTSNTAPGQLIVDGVNVPFINSQSSNSSAAGYLVVNGGTSDTTNSVFLNNAPVIDTIAGSHLGDGNKASVAAVPQPSAIVADAGRGIYIADRDPADGNYSVIRFVNTSAAPVIIGGRQIAPGTVQTIAGGGGDQTGTDNVPGTQANLDLVGGLALSADKKLLYFTTGFYSAIRVINVSPGASISSSNPDDGAISVGSANVRIGNIGTFYFGFSLSADTRGLAVHPTSGDVYVADAGNNRIFRITPDGTLTTFAGNGAATTDVEPLENGTFTPTTKPLLKPSDVEIEVTGSGASAVTTVYIADSGHGRIVKVTSGSLTRVAQLGSILTTPTGRQILDNPYPTGLALFGGSLYFANTNKHHVQRVVSTDNVVNVAGQTAMSCDPATSFDNCGDGGAPAAALFNFPTSSHDLPVTGLAADASGLFVSDSPRDPYQGRVRFVNLTGANVNVAGVAVAANTIKAIAGAGFARPYNGGLATSAELSRPVGVAVDNNNNLFVAESESSNSSLRFVNRGTSSVTVPDGTVTGLVVGASTIARVNAGSATVANTPIPANSASFGTLQGLAFVNGLGLFIVDSNSYTVSDPAFRVRSGRVLYYNTTGSTQTIYPQAENVGGSPLVVPSGYIVAIAGRVTIPDAGDSSGSIATAQRLVGPTDVAVHPTTGNIYVSVGSFFLNTNGSLTSMVGAVYKINRSTGEIAPLSLPSNKRYTGLAFDSAGRLHVAAFDDNAVLRETGSNTGVFNTLAAVQSPRDMAVDAAGNAYATSSGSHQIIKITGAGTTSGFAGKAGQAGYSGDNGGATSAQINIVTDLFKLSTDISGARGYHMTQTIGITVGAGGEVIFADTSNVRVRRVR
jgi:hypothetical protein